MPVIATEWEKMIFDCSGISFRFSFGACAVCQSHAERQSCIILFCAGTWIVQLQLLHGCSLRIQTWLQGWRAILSTMGHLQVRLQKASEKQPALPELPYHRFSNGDGILLVSTLSNGEVPKADSQASSTAQPRFKNGLPSAYKIGPGPPLP